MELDTGLWIDEAGASADLPERVREGQRERVRQVIDDGYTVFSLDAPERFDRAVEEIEGLWISRPSSVAFARDSPAMPFSSVDETERQPSYRLQDVHSHSEAARSLYLDRTIHELMATLFGEPAVAIQSLYFEWGSQQVLHRDPVLVPTAKPGHLLAAWIALEDIHEDSGALAYVPGSHRYPYYEFAPGQFMYDSALGDTRAGRALRSLTTKSSAGSWVSSRCCSRLGRVRCSSGTRASGTVVDRFATRTARDAASWSISRRALPTSSAPTRSWWMGRLRSSGPESFCGKVNGVGFRIRWLVDEGQRSPVLCSRTSSGLPSE